VEFGIPLTDAVRACTYNPAKSIGMEDRIGSLETGKEASFVVLNHDLSLKAVVFHGKIAVGEL